MDEPNKEQPPEPIPPVETPEVVETIDPPPTDRKSPEFMEYMRSMRKTSAKTAEEINAAMEKAQGKMSYAAVLLNRSTIWLRNHIINYPSLRERWMPGVAGAIPNEAQTLHRKPDKLPDRDEHGKLPAMLPVDSEQIARALEQEEAMFKKGLEKSELPDHFVNFAVTMQRITRTNFKNCIEAIHGTVTTNAFSLHFEKEQVMERLKGVRENLAQIDLFPYGSETRLALVTEEKELARQAREIDQQLIKTKEVTDDGVLTLSMVRQQAKRKDKPGFKPTVET